MGSGCARLSGHVGRGWFWQSRACRLTRKFLMGVLLMANGQASVNGTWQLCWADAIRGGLAHHHLRVTDAEKWLAAIVPGEVHLDLLRAGLIEEPTLGTNVLAALGGRVLLDLSTHLCSPVCGVDGSLVAIL